MIEPRTQNEYSCIVCGSTTNLIPEEISTPNNDEEQTVTVETVYICVDCEELVDATIATVDPTPF